MTTRSRLERAVRDARSARAEGAAAGQPRAARLGHGRVHRAAAAFARRGVSRDARGSRGGRSAAPRHRRVESRSRAADGRGAQRPRGGRRRPRAARWTCSTSAIVSTTGSAPGFRPLYPGALCVSAATGEGRDELIAAMERTPGARHRARDPGVRRRRGRSRADRASVPRRPDPSPRRPRTAACRSRPKCPQRVLARFPNAVVLPS